MGDDLVDNLWSDDPAKVRAAAARADALDAPNWPKIEGALTARAALAAERTAAETRRLAWATFVLAAVTVVLAVVTAIVAA